MYKRKRNLCQQSRYLSYEGVTCDSVFFVCSDGACRRGEMRVLALPVTKKCPDAIGPHRLS